MLYHASLESLAAAVDVLIITASGGAQSHHIVNDAVLKALGPRGVVINVGRGSVVDQSALTEALAQGVIHSAGLDVYENEPYVPEALLRLPNVVLLPHIAAKSERVIKAMSDSILANVESWFAGTGAITPILL